MLDAREPIRGLIRSVSKSMLLPLGEPRAVSQEKQPDKDQFKHFVETARKLGCDEDKEMFEKSLGKIAAYKPQKKPSKKAAKPIAKMKNHR